MQSKWNSLLVRKYWQGVTVMRTNEGMDKHNYFMIIKTPIWYKVGRDSSLEERHFQSATYAYILKGCLVGEEASAKSHGYLCPMEERLCKEP